MKRVAMQYSPMCAIPYVAMVDAGTVELVRSLGVEVVTRRRADPDLRSALDARRRWNRTWKPAAAWTKCAPPPSS
jgi:hypothetical protein